MSNIEGMNRSALSFLKLLRLDIPCSTRPTCLSPHQADDGGQVFDIQNTKIL